MKEKIISELEKLFGDFDLFGNMLGEMLQKGSIGEQKVENIKKLLVGKTILSAEFSSYSATNDTLTLCFTDATNLKIVSDPKNTFDGLSFYVKKTKTVEQEYDEEIE
jgi:hypothetical protein